MDIQPMKGSRFNLKYFGPNGHFPADLFACAVMVFTLSQGAYFLVSSNAGVNLNSNTWCWIGAWLILSSCYLGNRLRKLLRPSSKDSRLNELNEKLAAIFGTSIAVDKRLNSVKTFIFLTASIPLLYWSQVSTEATNYELEWINRGRQLPEFIEQNRFKQLSVYDFPLLREPTDPKLRKFVDGARWEVYFSQQFHPQDGWVLKPEAITNRADAQKLEKRASQIYKLALDHEDGNGAVLSLMIIAQAQSEQGNFDGAKNTILEAEQLLQSASIHQTCKLDSISLFYDYIEAKLEEQGKNSGQEANLLARVKYLASPFGTTDPTFLTPVLVPALFALLLSTLQAIAQSRLIDKGRNYLGKRLPLAQDIDDKLDVLDGLTIFALYDNNIDEADRLSHLMLAAAQSYAAEPLETIRLNNNTLHIQLTMQNTIT